MNAFNKISVIFFIVAILAGCGIAASNKNSAALSKINIGDSKATVIAIAGEPSSKEAYKGKEYWLYRINNSGTGERSRYTPLVIENGKVIGWGVKYWDDIRPPEAATQTVYGGGGTLVVPSNLYNQPNMAPFMTNPSSATVRGNTQPFQEQAPQQPIQNPSVNCIPNGMGGFRCQ